MAPVAAEPLRVATWAGDFNRKGPGLMLRELTREDPVPGVETLRKAAPDILLLTNIDYDARLVTLRALADRIEPGRYPHLFAARPNTGLPTGLDLDGDGRLGGPRDAQGYGWFSGQGGQALLSRWPLSLRVDHSDLLWRDLPGSAIRADDTGHDIQRLSSSAHWAVDVQHPGGTFTLLTLSATPPVFDGPEDRNGRRNRDEVLLWRHVLDGRLGAAPPGEVILLGNFNLDPDTGDGLREVMQQVLADPRLQDPLPGLPTVTWRRVGPMRVSYALPSRGFTIRDAGVTPPEENAGPHGLVWVDLSLR